MCFNMSIVGKYFKIKKKILNDESTFITIFYIKKTVFKCLNISIAVLPLTSIWNEHINDSGRQTNRKCLMNIPYFE